MADPSNLPPLPKDHLDHPEQWATGLDPATEKQKGFIAVLEDKNPGLVPSGGLDVEGMGKSEASEVIEKLKSGQAVVPSSDEKGQGRSDDVKAGQENDEQGETVGEKRKVPPTDPSPTTKPDADVKASEADPSSSNGTVAAKDDEGESEAGGKDLKKSKQTTLDGTFGAADATKEAEDEDDGEKQEQDRPSKKTRLDDDAKPSEEPDPSSNAARATTTSNNKEDAVAPASENTEVNTTVPGEGHLDHPENWSTGDEPATDKQKGFIKVLEKQKGAEGSGGDVEGLGKSEASEKIEELKEM